MLKNRKYEHWKILQDNKNLKERLKNVKNIEKCKKKNEFINIKLFYLFSLALCYPFSCTVP